jgi:hypothetical protein
MGVTISDEEVKAIGRQRLEEARLTRPHTERLPEPVNPLDGWRRTGERAGHHAATRRRQGSPRQTIH